MPRIANKLGKEENTTGELTSPNTKTVPKAGGTGKPGQTDPFGRTGRLEREPHTQMSG